MASREITYRSLLVVLTKDDYNPKCDNTQRKETMMETMRKNGVQSAVFLKSGLLYFSCYKRKMARKGMATVRDVLGTLGNPVFLMSSPTLAAVKDIDRTMHQKDAEILDGFGPALEEFKTVQTQFEKRIKEIQKLLLEHDIPYLFQEGLISLNEVPMAKTMNVDCGLEEKRMEKVMEKDLKGELRWSLRNMKRINGEVVPDPENPTVVVVVVVVVFGVGFFVVGFGVVVVVVVVGFGVVVVVVVVVGFGVVVLVVVVVFGVGFFVVGFGVVVVVVVVGFFVVVVVFGVVVVVFGECKFRIHKQIVATANVPAAQFIGDYNSDLNRYVTSALQVEFVRDNFTVYDLFAPPHVGEKYLWASMTDPREWKRDEGKEY
ncbi:hypothetical protein EGW08_014211 [Elysia chlorotica]|uniref:Uncharacterized protein n=1 Tax=Elysia chlorotica TaxID=188477 RepID=A0A3S1HF08_ELYCH|nr:hypothetical protein EGW08_014211 [Elysia chlorotica]